MMSRDVGKPSSYWELARSAPASILAPGLTQRLQRALYSECKGVTVHDVGAFLQDSAGGSLCLQNAFNTERRRSALAHSYGEFERYVTLWMFGTRRNPSHMWLIADPPPYDAETTATLVDKLTSAPNADIAAIGQYLRNSARAERWLGYISIRTANALRSLDATSLSAVRVATLHICSNHSANTVAPWRDGIRETVGCLPMTALGAIRNDRKTQRSTSLLFNAGLTNIGHAVMIDDEPLQFVRQFQNKDLVRAIEYRS